MAMVMPQTKFETILPKDEREDTFLAKADVSRNTIDLGCHNFLLVAPMVTILIFLESL